MPIPYRPQPMRRSTGKRTIPVDYFVLADVDFGGPMLGSLNDIEIRDIVIDGSGRLYRFVGVAPRTLSGGYDVMALSEGEWIVEPVKGRGLVYRAEDPAKAA